MKTKEKTQALARSDIYQFLSAAIRYPDAKRLESLRKLDPGALREAVVALDAPASARRALETLLRELSDTTSAQTESDYGRIFSHSVRGEAPLYELEYGRSALFQETHWLSDLSGFYRAFGLQISGDERGDHLGVELEFLHFLCFKEAYAFEHHGDERAKECLDAQRFFLREHLARWVFAFASRTRKASGEGLYGAVAAFLREFLLEECRRLEVAAGPAKMDLRPVDASEKDACISCSLPLSIETPH